MHLSPRKLLVLVVAGNQPQLPWLAVLEVRSMRAHAALFTSESRWLPPSASAGVPLWSGSSGTSCGALCSRFFAHTVLGAFAGLPRNHFKRRAYKISRGVPLAESKPYVAAVKAVGLVWPFLQLAGMSEVDDPLMTRTVEEFLLFSCGVDAYWETVWRDQASPGAKDSETVWKTTSPTKYAN